MYIVISFPIISYICQKIKKKNQLPGSEEAGLVADLAFLHQANIKFNSPGSAV